MQDGFVKVAARTPEVRVADVAFNVDACAKAVRHACAIDGAKVVALPELAVCGYTCEDLLWQDELLDASEHGVAEKFQTLIVASASSARPDVQAAVHHRLAVQTNPVGIES